MRRVILCLSLALICGLSALIQPAEAQITTFGASAIVINCPTLPGPGESPFDDPDHPCEKAVGITITVTNSETGEVYGSCETIDAGPEYDHGTCTVIAETEVPLTIREDPSTLPAGYSPVDNPTTITLPEGGPPPSAYFINVLQTQTEPPSVQPGDPYDMPIQVVNCPEAPSEPPGPLPVDVCDPAPGISFTVTDANTGEVYGSCVTDTLDIYRYAECKVTVPVGSTVIVTEDTSTVPAGYAPLEASVTREILEAAIQAGEGAYAPFINVLQTAPPAGAEPTPPPPSDAGAPPTQLPATGVGTAAHRSAVARQDGGYDLPISKIDCPTIPGDNEFPFEDWQHECEPGIGVNFEVTDADTGLFLGSCVTDLFDAPEPQPTAHCLVAVEPGTTVTVTEDTRTANPGYVPVEESITVTIPDPLPASGEGPWVRFINVLQTQLPDTGTGPSLRHATSFFR